MTEDSQPFNFLSDFDVTVFKEDYIESEINENKHYSQDEIEKHLMDSDPLIRLEICRYLFKNYKDNYSELKNILDKSLVDKYYKIRLISVYTLINMESEFMIQNINLILRIFQDENIQIKSLAVKILPKIFISGFQLDKNTAKFVLTILKNNYSDVCNVMAKLLVNIKIIDTEGLEILSEFLIHENRNLKLSVTKAFCNSGINALPFLLDKVIPYKDFNCQPVIEYLFDLGKQSIEYLLSMIDSPHERIFKNSINAIVDMDPNGIKRLFEWIGKRELNNVNNNKFHIKNCLYVTIDILLCRKKTSNSSDYKDLLAIIYSELFKKRNGFIDLLLSDDKNVRSVIRKILKSLGSLIIPDLEIAIAQSQPRLISEIIRLLAVIGPSSLNILIKLLDNKNIPIVKETIGALITFGPPGFEHIKKIIPHESNKVVMSITRSLRKCGKEGFALLLELINNPDKSVVIATIKSIQKFGKIALDPIFKIIPKADPEVLNAALSAIETMEDKDFEKYIEMLYNDNVNICLAGLSGLRYTGENVYSHVIKLIDEDNPLVRRKVVLCLEQCGDIAFDQLVRKVYDCDADVVYYSLNILSNFKERAIPIYNQLLYDENFSVISKDTIIDNLAECGNDSIQYIINALENFKSDPLLFKEIIYVLSYQYQGTELQKYTKEIIINIKNVNEHIRTLTERILTKIGQPALNEILLLLETVGPEDLSEPDYVFRLGNILSMLDCENTQISEHVLGIFSLLRIISSDERGRNICRSILDKFKV